MPEDRGNHSDPRRRKIACSHMEETAAFVDRLYSTIRKESVVFEDGVNRRARKRGNRLS